MNNYIINQMKISTVLIITFLGISACSAQKLPDTNVQIQQALLAVPEAFREGATVLGYKKTNELSVIREGNNPMICLADDPTKDGFSVAGYHRDLEPFMKLGRTLKSEGRSATEIFDLREKAVKSGAISIPQGSTLYIVSGQFDEQGQPTDLYQRFVVYIPFATTESTGLALKPSYPGGPWIMNPGTHRAHIMINPTRVKDQ